MGALTYEPDYHFYEKESSIDLDVIAKECSKILKTDYSEIEKMFNV